MRIAVSTTKGGLDDDVCQVFGRCSYFTILEASDKGIEDVTVTENRGAVSGGGAGITAAQQIIDENIGAVISGNFGPNASKVLMSSDIKMYQAQGNVKEAVEKLRAGDLKLVDAPTVKGHHGGGRS